MSRYASARMGRRIGACNLYPPFALDAVRVLEQVSNCQCHRSREAVLAVLQCLAGSRTGDRRNCFAILVVGRKMIL